MPPWVMMTFLFSPLNVKLNSQKKKILLISFFFFLSWQPRESSFFIQKMSMMQFSLPSERFLLKKKKILNVSPIQACCSSLVHGRIHTKIPALKKRRRGSGRSSRRWRIDFFSLISRRRSKIIKVKRTSNYWIIFRLFWKKMKYIKKRKRWEKKREKNLIPLLKIQSISLISFLFPPTHPNSSAHLIVTHSPSSSSYFIPFPLPHSPSTNSIISSNVVFLSSRILIISSSNLQLIIKTDVRVGNF